MSLDALNQELGVLSGTVTDLSSDLGAEGQDGEYVPITINFSDGSRLSSAYWRLVGTGSFVLNSFDHGTGRSGYDVDAVGELRAAVVGRRCLDVRVDTMTGDLTVTFVGELHLVAFRFRALFEDWELTLPDGTSYWSNHVSL